MSSNEMLAMPVLITDSDGSDDDERSTVHRRDEQQHLEFIEQSLYVQSEMEQPQSHRLASTQCRHVLPSPYATEHIDVTALDLGTQQTKPASSSTQPINQSPVAASLVSGSLDSSQVYADYDRDRHSRDAILQQADGLVLPEATCCVVFWRVEFQKRSQPHVHLHCFIVHDV